MQKKLTAKALPAVLPWRDDVRRCKALVWLGCVGAEAAVLAN